MKSDVNDDATRSDTRVRYCITALLVCILFLPQLAINLGVASISFSLPMLYVLACALLLQKIAIPDLARFLSYAFAATAWLASLLFNRGTSSAPSLVLLFAIYLPLLLRATGEVSKHQYEFVLKRYSDLAGVLAVAALVQFCGQFFIHGGWLYDIRSLLPQMLKTQGNYHSSAYTGEIFRSNGFFLREPSTLSTIAGFAILAELALLRRVKMLALHSAGLIAALSGTGIFILLIGLAVPLLMRAPLKLLIAGTVLIGLLFLLGDLPGISMLSARLDEFSRPGTSAYARFVAPVAFVREALDRFPWTMIVGNGPGTILRAIRTSGTSIEIFDPTWAKIIFEYGLLGGLAMACFIFALFRGSRASAGIVAGLIYAWLFSGGLLLQPDFAGLMFLFAIAWADEHPMLAARRQLKRGT